MGQKGFITCNGANLYYEIAGAGETIVFLHGAPLDSRMWESQMKTFSSQYQVVRCDMRGMGQSHDPCTPFTLYDDIHALLNQLQISRASFVGASFGSYVGIEFAMAYPEMVESLILVCPGGFAPPSQDRQAGFQKLQEQMDKGNLDEALEINLHHYLDGPDQERGRVQLNRQWLKDIYREIFQQTHTMTTPKGLEPDPRSRLEEVAVPTLVLSGELDYPDFLQAAESIVSKIPDAQQLFCKNSAHFPSIDSPDEFYETITNFLNKSAHKDH